MGDKKKKTCTGRPVKDFLIQFKWHTGDLFDLFQEQVEHLKRDIRRALAADRFIVYMSCPISPRGGGNSSTNVAIADYTADRLRGKYGPRVFILNPAAYQMESKEGTGLINLHARTLENRDSSGKRKIDVSELSPSGGDYMRMWTRVLVEDDYQQISEKRRGKNLGGAFSAYYFLGPEDVYAFFAQRGTNTVVAGVEDYFASQFAVNPDFRKSYSKFKEFTDEWEQTRKDFIQYYSLRAGANFSKGAHDEWNIWVQLNRRRRSDEAYGLGEEIAGYMEGRQIDLGAADAETSDGYAEPAP